jgi:hypothetical protein
MSLAQKEWWNLACEKGLVDLGYYVLRNRAGEYLLFCILLFNTKPACYGLDNLKKEQKGVH